MRPIVANRARLALAIIMMNQRAQWFTRPELDNPLPATRFAWRYAQRQCAAAAFVLLLLHGFEPEHGIHLVPGFDLDITDGFEPLLVEDAVLSFGDSLAEPDKELLGSLWRSAETSALEEGIDTRETLDQLLRLSLKLSDLALAQVASHDHELAGLTGADLARWEGGDFGAFERSGLGQAPNHQPAGRELCVARIFAAIILDDQVSPGASPTQIKLRVDAKLEQLRDSGAPDNDMRLANLVHLALLKFEWADFWSRQR
jgi:hypothetical protein